MDSRKRRSPLRTAIQKFASSRPGAWTFSHILPAIDRYFLRLTGESRSCTSMIMGLPVLKLTTTGAKSGLPRETPLVFIRDEEEPDQFAIIASNFGQQRNPAWYYNLRANPRAKCTIAGSTGEYIAHEAGGEEYDRFWRYAELTYAGYPVYKARAGERRIPVIVMRPVQQE